MKKFRFRLDPVIRVRKHELELERRELGRAQGRLADANRAVLEAERRTAEASNRLMMRAQDGISAGDFALEEGALVAGQEVILQNKELALDALQLVDVVRQRVAEAYTRLRTIEVLRERALEVYEAEQRRGEQKEMDEIAGRIRYSRGLGTSLLRVEKGGS